MDTKRAICKLLQWIDEYDIDFQVVTGGIYGCIGEGGRIRQARTEHKAIFDALLSNNNSLIPYWISDWNKQPHVQQYLKESVEFLQFTPADPAAIAVYVSGRGIDPIFQQKKFVTGWHHVLVEFNEESKEFIGKIVKQGSCKLPGEVPPKPVKGAGITMIHGIQTDVFLDYMTSCLMKQD